MKYKNIETAEFISRPNRFIANVLLSGKETTVHVKNTGRCKELLLPGSTVYLSEGENPSRKTKYDLVAVEKVLTDKSSILINMDSQAPNEVFSEWIREGNFFQKKRWSEGKFSLVLPDLIFTWRTEREKPFWR